VKIFVAHDGGSGCQWYRMQLPLDELAKHDGFDVVMADAGDSVTGTPTITLRDLEGYDVIVGQRLNKHSGLEVWRRAWAPHRRLVYDLDDDIYSIGPENWQAFHLYNRGDILDAVTHSAQIADLISVTTDYLAGVMTERTGNESAAVLPNCIPEWVCDLPREPRTHPAVGWQGGASHGADVGLVTGPVRRFLKRFPDWELRLAGTDFRPSFKVAKERAHYSQWVQVNKDPEGFYNALDFDIGLAPLIDNAFSRSKCVDSSMRVCTDRGVIPAGSLEPGMQVWHGGWRKIEAAVHDVPRPGLLITMKDGYQLRLTPEHRMMVNGIWTRAEHIRPDDLMAMEREWAGPQHLVRVPWPADGRMSRAGNASRLATIEAAGRFDPDAFLTATDGPKLDITPRWGRLLGAFAGDGSVGQATTVQISCDGQDQDWIDLLMNDFRACGFNPRTESITMFNGTILRRRGIRVGSAHLLRVLASLGVTRPRSNGNPIRVPCVPEVIWRSPRDVIAEFLAGYFESDGWCIKGNGLAVVSKDEALCRDVQRLLLLFGITSRLHPVVHKAQNGYTGTYWHVNMRRAEADVFEKEIGFRSERKRARLAEVTDKSRSNRYQPMNWNRTVEAVEQCFIDPIDIQVEGSVFVLAGFTSHNSPVKALEYMARGIPVIASDVEPYKNFVRHGITGFLVREDGHSWLGYLSELAADDKLRQKMGAAGREFAREWSVERNWWRWGQAYTRLFARSHSV
jgi:LAGLIDADG-like domain/Glycosyl transferases group 1